MDDDPLTTSDDTGWLLIIAISANNADTDFNSAATLSSIRGSLSTLLEVDDFLFGRFKLLLDSFLCHFSQLALMPMCKVSPYYLITQEKGCPKATFEYRA